MSNVQGCLLEVSVVKCKHLNHTEFESNQEDYVCIEYGSNRYHTKTCKDGDQALVFHEKFAFTLFEGSMEITISVFNHKDDFVGRGRAQLQRVISLGYDDTTWPIFSENGRTTGEVCLMLCCPSIKMLVPSYSPYMTPIAQQELCHSLATYPSSSSCYAPTTYISNPYYPNGNGTNMSRGVKRPLLVEEYVENEEELGRDPMRRKVTIEEEGNYMQSNELLDISMDEFLDIRSPTNLDEDTEMACGSHRPSHPYSKMWDTICF